MKNMYQFLASLTETVGEIPMVADLDPIPTVPGASSDLGAAVVKMCLSLVALLLVVWLTYWMVRRLIAYRLQKGVGIDSISVLEKKMISAKTMLYLVQVENKKILIAESQVEIKRLESFIELDEGSDHNSVPS